MISGGVYYWQMYFGRSCLAVWQIIPVQLRQGTKNGPYKNPQVEPWWTMDPFFPSAGFDQPAAACGIRGASESQGPTTGLQGLSGWIPLSWRVSNASNRSNVNFNPYQPLISVNTGWLIAVVPPNNNTNGYWNGISPSHKQRFGFINQGLTLFPIF